MSVPDGFKVSEVGVIPVDWDVKRLGDIADVKTGPFGSSLHEKDYVDDGTPIITVEHLSDKGVVHKNLPMVSDYDKNRLSSYILKTGDIVFSRVGSVDRNSLIRDLEDGWLFSSRLLRIRINNKNIAPAYLSYHFLQESTKQRIRSVAVGQTMASLNTAILKGIEITLPPLAEQKAIAQSLSDVDNLITAIDKLITKKRNIKQGTMQELLTGKKRLSGFTGEWDVKKLGELGYSNRPTIKAGPFGSSLKKEFYVKKGYKIYGQEQVIAGDLSIGNYYIDFDLFEKLKSCEIRPNDILISLVGTFGKVMVVPDNIERGIINPRLIRLSLNANLVYSYFLQYWLISSDTQKLLSETSHGGTMGIINAKVLSGLNIPLPPLPEQKVIAKILTEMDEEIEALEKKREKYKNIKQGMMQQLLTGKTRLKINLEDR
ncbi:MAG: restriction endonuclease subunit S [Sphaerospermopsis sp.]|nr:restriction endonuclease subunit S [Sphaerospermopsis sp.]